MKPIPPRHVKRQAPFTKPLCSIATITKVTILANLNNHTSWSIDKSMPRNTLPHAVTVESIGAQGDGIARGPDGRYYVPFAAPGDQLEVQPGATRGDGREARITRIVAPGPDRISPACRHFGTCGGCALQHLSPDAVAALKRDRIAAALARRGLRGFELAATLRIAPGARRRARFVLRRKKITAFGFRAPRSHTIVNITQCPAIRPALAALIAPLRELAHAIDALGQDAEVSVTETDSGIDMTLRPAAGGDPSLEDRERLAAFADTHDIARIAWDGGAGAEPLAARRLPRAAFGSAAVDLPLDAFLQPSLAGENAIVDAVTGAIAKATRIADLYAGCGTFTFPLSDIAPVHAYEGTQSMVAAMRRAAAGRPVTAYCRDLARSPLDESELAAFDAIVFDPPRAGAKSQAATIARAQASVVIAVSCNPATLGRDLRLLVDGGYRLESVLPIDQFPWSPHVEIVAVLKR
jgi:23S rRNA (uracil1939-C5)-methyltransferase